MQSAPPTIDENDRIAALQRLEILDTPAEAAYDRLVLIASKVFQMPIALVSLVDEERQWFKARVGLEAQETPREFAFCAHAIHDDGLFVVEDASQDERFHDNPLVAGDPDIRFYAGAPIPAPTGERLGTLCVIDRKPRTLDPEQREILSMLALQAAEALVTRQVALTLRDAFNAESSDDRREALNQVSHELRTPMTPMMLVLERLQRRTDDPDLRDELATLRRNLIRLDAAVSATTRTLSGGS